MEGSKWLRVQFRGAVFALVLLPFSAAGVVFFSTGDPDFNTSAPEGELAGSGWQLQGFWGQFLGTPISSNQFITAKHVGGTTNDLFFLNGHAHSVTAAFQHPVADLTVWQISGMFTDWAELYAASDEVGKPLVVFGRGRQRGEELQVAGKLRGWLWGIGDGRLRWGENEVMAVTDQRGNTVIASNRVECLRAIFRTNAGPNEAHLSTGDSGGAVFMRDGEVWKLAGISFSVDGKYNTNSFGQGFDASVFDERGLYKGSARLWDYRYGAHIQPGGFYATRISAYRSWIEDIIENGHVYAGVIVESAEEASGPYEPVLEADLDAGAQTIALAAPGTSRFYRLSAPAAVRIIDINSRDGRLLLHFKEEVKEESPFKNQTENGN